MRRNLYPSPISQSHLLAHQPLAKRVMSNFFMHTLQSRKLDRIDWKVGGSGQRETDVPFYSVKDLEKRTDYAGVLTLFEDDYEIHHHTTDENDIQKLEHFVH